MRLGQLARQVGISQKDIVSFLQKEKDIELKVHPNVKVEDDLANLIIKNFAKPEEEITEAEPLTASKAPKIESSKVAAIEGFVEALKSKAVEKIAAPEIGSPAEIKEYVQGEEFVRPEGPIEKIETEIPKLEGFKVIGKIDLPQFHKEVPAPDLEPKDTTEAVKDETATENDAPVSLPNATPLFNNRPKREPRKEKPRSVRSKKPQISEDDRKTKELERTERQRLAMKKAKKAAARKKHLDLVKSYDTVQKPKSKSKKNPKVAAIEELKTAASKTSLGHQVVNTSSKPKNEPKTLIGKIWRWMNTE
jgi:translation initiation factor IF-2